jgi:hypothetical protein
MKYVLAIASLLLAGCSAATTSTPAPSQDPTSEPTTQVTVTGAPQRPVVVGVLVGARLTEVRAALEQKGMRVDVRRRALCTPGVVLHQKPGPRTEVAPGSTVRLVVSQYPPAASCIAPPAREAARALQRWALGDGPVPAFADRVRLLVANHPRRTLTPAEAAGRSSWVLDLAYAERSDVRILDALAESPMVAARVPPFWCVGRGRAPSEDLLRRLPWSWTLTTRVDDTTACLQVAAVQVWVDDRRRITDVNLLLGSP